MNEPTYREMSFEKAENWTTYYRVERDSANRVVESFDGKHCSNIYYIDLGLALFIGTS